MNGDSDQGPRLLRPSNMGAPPGSTTPRQDPLVGQTIAGRYWIERSIGEGAMGVVFAARHVSVGRPFAVKVLRGEMANDAELTARFFQEARAAGAIGNPHIVEVSDVGRLPDGSSYIVMELLQGRSLGGAISEVRGPLPLPRVLHLGAQIAHALAAAHAANVIHRDLKPENVMLVPRAGDPEFVKILDFGLAKIEGASGAPMTRQGAVFGTPHYMSPEQGMGVRVEPRTDVYSLGVILYEMASGQCPFQGRNMNDIVRQHMVQPPVPLSALGRGIAVPPAFDALVLRCLAKRPDARPTMGEVAVELERFATNPAALAQSARGGAAARAPGRGALIASLLVLALIVVALVVGLVVVRARSSTQHGAPPSASTDH
jgi:serine/threonine protein kinase